MGRILDAQTLKEYCRSTTVKDVGVYEAATFAAEDFLDDELGRRIETAAAGAARVYRPASRHSELLRIHDCNGITSVTENGVLLTVGTGYITEPLNGINDAGKAVPIDTLVKPNGCWAWNGYATTVSVAVTTWGWATIPPMWVEAAKVAGKAYVEYRDIKFGLAALSEAGGVGERQAKAVQDCINALQTWRTAVIA